MIFNFEGLTPDFFVLQYWYVALRKHIVNCVGFLGS